jgi:hypothetical protein
MAKQMPARRGCVTNHIGTLDGDWHARITAGETRSHATMMAAVCDDALLQKHWPQLLHTTKDKTLTRAEKSALANLPRPSAGLQAARVG